MFQYLGLTPNQVYEVNVHLNTSAPDAYNYHTFVDDEGPQWAIECDEEYGDYYIRKGDGDIVAASSNGEPFYEHFDYFT